MKQPEFTETQVDSFGRILIRAFAAWLARPYLHQEGDAHHLRVSRNLAEMIYGDESINKISKERP